MANHGERGGGEMRNNRVPYRWQARHNSRGFATQLNVASVYDGEDMSLREAKKGTGRGDVIRC